ncbi:MAG: glycosyltransferase family 4 protein [Planctomycetota bacterium]
MSTVAVGRPLPSRVVVTAHRLRLGGLSRYLVEHANAILRCGIDTRVVVPRSEAAEFVGDSFAGVTYVVDRLRAQDVLRALGTNRAGVVRLVTGRAPPDTRLAAALALRRVALIESIHQPATRPGIRLGRRVFYALRPKRRYWCFGFTKGMQQHLLEYVPSLRSRIRCVREGVDLLGYRPAPGERGPGPIRIGSLSRLDEFQKDHATLLRAARCLRDRSIEFELTIGGDGQDRTMLEQLADALGVTDRVRFAGWVNDPQAFMHRHDIFVNSTRFESFGRTNIEAAASALPVVASRVLGCVETVEHEFGGLLVEPDSPESLADAIERLVKDSTLRESLARNAIHFAQGFTMDVHTRALFDACGFAIPGCKH